MSYFKDFDREKLGEYKLDMYSRAYIDWACPDVHPTKFLDEMSSVRGVIWTIRFINTLAWILVIASTFELAM